MISSNAPTLPLLTTTPSAEKTSSVVGNRSVLASVILEPSTNLPVGGRSVGGASSTCNEPSSEVWETFATALAGSNTFLSRSSFTAA
ncbi:Uncharacterised protein [Mycobacterium tuberculosis]|uniref:Uncharacterized protein n=1 Tax=Mycobacterium tuberculosis TaxID=1773 RepID=A0A654ZP78_MYCTX|nr:Uncharacterised protein [Mycobacterium tuberculosis]CKT46730.1 Uncharacterised protein [Mycobacterium tuberculosis]CKV35524.1 Uncharacterised protein [Mycobacterium tuberculosis]COY51637.1 Uncharacterised protein [Mycobacterium tuberculosis]